MRKLTLSAPDYQNFLYPVVGGTTAKNDEEWQTLRRLMQVFRELPETTEIPLSGMEEEAEERGIADLL